MSKKHKTLKEILFFAFERTAGRGVGHTYANSEGFKERGIYFVASHEQAKNLKDRGVRAHVWRGVDYIRGLKEPIGFDHFLLQMLADDDSRRIQKLEDEIRKLKEKQDE